RGGKPHKGFCALLRAACYRPEDRHPQVHQQAVIAVEARCHEPRVEAVHRHPGPFETSLSRLTLGRCRTTPIAETSRRLRTPSWPLWRRRRVRVRRGSPPPSPPPPHPP